jgi:4-hydroxy-2-oxoglutarate aldolase
MKLEFGGVIPPVTTPFAADGSLLYDSLVQNLHQYLSTSVSGFLLLGSNGEAPHLAESERLAVVERAAALLPPDRHLLVGVGFPTLKGSLDFLETIRDFRIDAVLVGVPSYYRNRMKDEALCRFFTGVADHSPFPVLLYNVPQFTGIELSPALIGELARHQNVIGMKESSGNLIYVERVLLETQEQNFQIILGSADILGPAMVLGIRAAVLAVACVLPELALRLMADYEEGYDIRDRQLLLSRISRLLTVQYGIAGLKYAMDLFDYDGKFCRLPLLPLNSDEKEAIESALQPLIAEDRAQHPVPQPDLAI